MNTFAPPTPGPPTDEQLIRLAVQNLACHPQAQRRYVQMGWMTRAIGNLSRIGASLDGLVAQGKIDAEQADRIADLRNLVQRTMERRSDLVDVTAAGSREYLFTSALEDADWEAIRQQAREVHHILAGETSVFVSIMAK
jgi:hypothetical protein